MRKFTPDRKIKFKCGECGKDSTATEWYKSTATRFSSIRRLPNMGGGSYRCPHCGHIGRSSDMTQIIYGSDGSCTTATMTRHYSIGEEA